MTSRCQPGGTEWSPFCNRRTGVMLTHLAGAVGFTGTRADAVIWTANEARGEGPGKTSDTSPPGVISTVYASSVVAQSFVLN
jgi:hypothetical protein